MAAMKKMIRKKKKILYFALYFKFHFDSVFEHFIPFHIFIALLHYIIIYYTINVIIITVIYVLYCLPHYYYVNDNTKLCNIILIDESFNQRLQLPQSFSDLIPNLSCTIIPYFHCII